jgi:hypothetical protein
LPLSSIAFSSRLMVICKPEAATISKTS